MLDFTPLPPEDRGIPARAVADFERRLTESRVRMHGFLMLSGGRPIAERYWPPFGADTNHRMYSVTKSFTALAVGLLIGEGRIALTDRICKYFPDKLPPNGAHPWLWETTVEDMLTMRTCHGATTYKTYGGDWVESFFRVPPDHIPGTIFAYDTSSSHVLAALTERLTGMDMLDYLRRGALGELGFSQNSFILKDPYGVSQGGTGLMCTLRDAARAAYLCLHAGQYGGRQLIPRDFMLRALSNHVPTDLQPSLDEQFGYGYFFWMPRKPGFVMYGMGGQLALCFPEADFCLVTMADTIGYPEGLRLIYDSFYASVWPYIATAPAPAERAPGPALLRGRYTFYPNDMGWKWLEADTERGELRFETAGGAFTLGFGDGVFVQNPAFPGTPYPCECAGESKAGHLILRSYVTGQEQGHMCMDLGPKDTRLGVRLVSTGEPFFSRFRGFLSAEISK